MSRLIDVLVTNLILALCAVVTSTISGFVGMAGGVLLLAILAPFFSPVELIPIHAATQIFSNFSRAALSWRSIQWKIVRDFSLGSLLGIMIGRQFILDLPERYFNIVIAIFVITIIWLPQPKFLKKINIGFFWVGAFTGFAGLFLGAVGLLIKPFYLRTNLNRYQFIATEALGQSFQHLFKVLAYMTVGFSVSKHFDLLVWLVPAVILGSYFGKLILHRLPDKTFRLIVQIALTIMSARMIYISIHGLSNGV